MITLKHIKMLLRIHAHLEHTHSSKLFRRYLCVPETPPPLLVLLGKKCYAETHLVGLQHCLVGQTMLKKCGYCSKSGALSVLSPFGFLPSAGLVPTEARPWQGPLACCGTAAGWGQQRVLCGPAQPAHVPLHSLHTDRISSRYPLHTDLTPNQFSKAVLWKVALQQRTPGYGPHFRSPLF